MICLMLGEIWTCIVGRSSLSILKESQTLPALPPPPHQPSLFASSPAHLFPTDLYSAILPIAPPTPDPCQTHSVVLVSSYQPSPTTSNPRCPSTQRLTHRPEPPSPSPQNLNPCIPSIFALPHSCSNTLQLQSTLFSIPTHHTPNLHHFLRQCTITQSPRLGTRIPLPTPTIPHDLLLHFKNKQQNLSKLFTPPTFKLHQEIAMPPLTRTPNTHSRPAMIPPSPPPQQLSGRVEGKER